MAADAEAEAALAREAARAEAAEAEAEELRAQVAALKVEAQAARPDGFFGGGGGAPPMSDDPLTMLVMISARFTKDVFITQPTFVEDLGRALRAKGVNAYWVDADAGDDFGEMTKYGLKHMRVMVSLCTETYGQKTDSPYCSFKEVKAAAIAEAKGACTIVPIRLCS
jgi:hypothetical protein